MRLTMLILGMFAVANAAIAMTIQGASPAAPPAGTPQTAPPAQAAAMQRDDSSGLRRGTIEAVNVAGGTFHVYGQGLTFDAKRVKVFARDGKATSVYSLRKGSTVRFTLDPGDRLHRRVAVIYLD
jgi:hypothetical protein